MRININLQRIAFGATSLPLFCLLTGCFQTFYKAITPDKNTVVQNYTQQYENRYFILREGSNAYYMNDRILSEDKKTISCILDTLPQEHKLHLRNGRGGNMRYKPSQPEASVLNEVHLYIPTDKTARIGSEYTLSLDKVEKIEVIEKNKGKTTASYVLSGVGVAVSSLALVVIIAAALKSSCPFISAYDGTQMKLQGEVYGGAIYPQLCRNDYLKLNMAPTKSGRLQLQISNELKEKQFTDIAELIVVTHDKGVTIVADETGSIHSISKPNLPIAAISGGKDVLPLISRQNDGLSFNFDDTVSAQENNNKLNLSFDKPENKTSAKLILRLKNSYWLDMVYGKFTQGFGKYYPTFIKKERSVPVEKLMRWKSQQQLPLLISLHTKEGWQVQQNLNFVGPLANREIAIPINLSNNNDQRIQIQLSAGFMFWEIDYAALDFSEDIKVAVTKLLPLSAIDETGTDVTSLLMKEDNNYLQQPEPGNATVIEYAYSPLSDSTKSQTFILHAKGYYEHVRNYNSKINMNFLKQFKRPGAMSAYSMELYKQTTDSNPNTLVKK